jgi:hypothetical protein
MVQYDWGVAGMHLVRREHGDARMMMFLIPGEEILAEGAGMLVGGRNKNPPKVPGIKTNQEIL